MKDLVFKDGSNRVLTNSLLVAEKFDKRHADVIRSIEKILSTEDESLNAKMRLAFVSASYEDSTGKSNPMYVMNRKGFSILVMGYNGVQALRFKSDFYDAFDVMEARLKELQVPQSYAAALRQLADEVEAKEKAQFLLEQKTEQLDESMKWYSIKRYAKEKGLNWRKINWRKLKALSYEHGYEIKKIFDGNYGQVNIYHIDIFNIYFSH